MPLLKFNVVLNTMAVVSDVSGHLDRVAIEKSGVNDNGMWLVLKTNQGM